VSGSSLRISTGNRVTGTVRAPERGRTGRPELGSAVRLEAAWRILAMVGVALTAAAIASVVPSWIPPRFGNVNWEFAAVADVATMLPLLAIALGGSLAAAAALRRRKALLALGVGFVVLGLAMIACLLVFSTTAVIAVRNTQGAPLPAAVGVKRVVARTLWSLSVGIVGCAAAAVASFRIYSNSRKGTRA
jgi:hypothetical protein